MLTKLTSKQKEILNFFRNNQGLSLYSASKMMGKDSSYVLAIMNLLEVKGYIKVPLGYDGKRDFKIIEFLDKKIEVDEPEDEQTGE